jgi:hypothetical protein
MSKTEQIAASADAMLSMRAHCVCPRVEIHCAISGGELVPNLRKASEIRSIIRSQVNPAYPLAANPLVANGQKLIPSVTRVFNRDRQMYVYLQAYRHPAPPASGSSATGASPVAAEHPFFAYVGLYRNQKLAMETAPIAVMPQPGTRLGIVPLSFQVSLGNLEAGSYQCQISVLDPAGNRAAFWQGTIMVLQ